MVYGCIDLQLEKILSTHHDKEKKHRKRRSCSLGVDKNMTTSEFTAQDKQGLVAVVEQWGITMEHKAEHATR